jgi:REP element-mobilizing transposase RayT
MSTHRIHNEKPEFYFCTITCYKWIPLIEAACLYEEIYKWFNILPSFNCLLSGFAIMPNHVHFLLYQEETAPLLNKVISNGKRFLAYDIVKGLKNKSNILLLNYLERSVSLKECIKNDRIHKIFSTSFDAKLCDSERMIENVLDYIHYNPVSGKWELAATYLDYPHSSARFYECNERHSEVNIVHYKDILDRNYK